MRRFAKLAATLVVAGGLVLGAAAAPAQADHYGNGTLRGVYSEFSECVRVGNLGVQNGWWDHPFYCEYHPEYGPPSGLYFLWSVGQ